MRSVSTVRNILCAGAAAICVAGSTVPAQAAGLFDFLADVFDPPRQQYTRPPLGVQVNPRRQHKPAEVHYGPDGQPTIRRGGAKAVADRAEKRRVKNTAIDPVKNPNWYLEDPTLRRGDIVVLKDRVLVFNGGQGRRLREDFSSLEKSSMSKAEREKLLKSTGTVAGLPEPSTPVAKEAALKPAETPKATP